MQHVIRTEKYLLIFCFGAVHKVRYAILTSLLCHTLSHVTGPLKARYTSRPPIFIIPSTKTRTKPPVKIFSQLFAGFLSGDFVRGSLVWKALSGVVFVRSPFCQNTSVTTE